MAYADIKMMHANGYTKQVPVGFSFTALFFGAWVPLFRWDLYWTALALLFHVAFRVTAHRMNSEELFHAVMLTSWVWHFLFAWYYNSWYHARLLKRGYIQVGAEVPRDLKQMY